MDIKFNCKMIVASVFILNVFVLCKGLVKG